LVRRRGARGSAVREAKASRGGGRPGGDLLERPALLDDRPQEGFVDALLVFVRRERDRRRKQGFACGNIVTTREVLTEPAQVEFDIVPEDGEAVPMQTAKPSAEE
jgi:hypothetical protein